jgi:hypothetical protein
MLSGASTVIVDGGDGSYTYGKERRNTKLGLYMKEFGDCIGFCMHFQSPESQADDMANS